MASKYFCKFPECSFETSDRSCMDNHHIIPKAMPGTTNRPSNMILLCPSCHRAVYVPGMLSGHHSIKKDNSIIIKGKRASTKGPALEYVKVSDGNTYYFFYRDGDIWSM